MISVLFLMPSLRLGGAERQVIDLVNHLSAKNFKANLFTFEKDLDLLEYLDRGKVTFHNQPRKFKFDLSVSRKIAKIIIGEKIDILHCTLQMALLYAYVGRFLSGRKVRLVNAIHTTVNRDAKHELYDRLLYVPLMHRCDQIIAVCENQREHWSRKYPHLALKIVAIHNGIDFHRFHDDLPVAEKTNIRASLGARDGELLIGMVAGFRPEKGHEYAFKAVKILMERNMKVRLLLIGDGERRAYLERLALNLGIDHQVTWLGFQQDPKPYISVMDIVLMSSVAVETFSIALLEALAMGKPVIATDLGGTSEMVHDGINGFLVKPRDPSSIADKIISLIADQEVLRKLSLRARESVTTRFGMSEMVRKTENLLLSM